MKKLILIGLALLAFGCSESHKSPTAPDTSSVAVSSSTTGSSAVSVSAGSSAVVGSSSSVASLGRIVIGMVPVGLKRTAFYAEDSVAPSPTDSIVVDTSATNIELGTLKTSKAFFFIVRNVGGAPIESLTVSTDNGAVTMTPGFIPVLNTDQTSSLQQIAELDVVHGSDILNRGFKKPLLPYGRQTFNLIFNGKTGGQPFHASFKLGMSAIYVAFTGGTKTIAGNLWDYSTLVDSVSTYNGVSCSVNALGRAVSANDTILQSLAVTLTSTTTTSDCAIIPYTAGAM